MKGFKYWQYTNKDSSTFYTNGHEYIDSPDGYVYYTEFKTEGEQSNQSKAFKGPLYLIVDGLSWSATGSFAQMAAKRENTTIIGNESGSATNGNCGVYNVMVTLPNSQIRLSMRGRNS